ncbi:DUF1990 domain-containing protein [Streptomyces sp. LP05-1]|uniref:DUF1990 domain-containing protein n=1 Tax=Streptomyces pyxinae TaxID=2970734 RepID=A0ABT2CJ08_9ACTN|nr:DUF1990 domain-containing protein [Streptomyces sp. LP05-1]MCS0637406.1 DUF1990 domain-containing protein [Streptomyces sp. LP05-1]
MNRPPHTPRTTPAARPDRTESTESTESAESGTGGAGGTGASGGGPGFSYPEVGATRSAVLPDGYHQLRYATRIGRGQETFAAAGAAVTTWRMHRASGARIRAGAERAAPGVAVKVALGFPPVGLVAPCRVIWTAYEPERTGFAYGTLPGHPECGEEAFLVELRPDGSVWFTVTAFSRPARWYTRLAGPLVPPCQRAYARRLGRVLRRLAR